MRRSKTRNIVTSGMAAFILPFLAGCPYQTQALFADERDYDRRVSLSRLREVETLELTQSEEGIADLEGDVDMAAQRELVEQSQERFEAMRTRELTIEQARAATLRNNLDLRVALIEPTVAAEAVNEEEGRFEALLFSNAQINNVDDAVATDLAAGQSQTIFFQPGLRIPLYTGGEFELSTPYTRTRTDNQFATLNPSQEQNLEFSVSQPLLRNAGRRATTFQIRVADIDRQVSEAQTKLEVTRQVAAADRAYWRLYAARRAVEVRVQQYELAVEQLGRARRRFEAGAEAEVEVIRAESGVADRVEDIITAQNEVLLRQRELKELMNIPGLDVDSGENLIPASTPDPVRYALDPDKLAEQAVDERAELLEIELNLARDAATIAFQKNEALPLLSLDYTYRVNGLGDEFTEAVRVASENRFETWELGITAEIPLGNEQRESAVQQAVLSRLQRLSTEASRRQTIVREVFDAVDNIESGFQRILASRQAVILNTRTLQAEQRQFEVGRVTSTDVLEADADLAESRLNEIEAIVDYQIAQVDLAFATGTLLGASRVEWGPIDPRETPAPHEARPSLQGKASASSTTG